MGTRGACGVVINGQVKMGYQQYDSYPSGVGVDILNELYTLTKDMDSFRHNARKLEVVDEETPMPKNVTAMVRARGLEVDNPNGGDIGWYWLLRDTQGSIELKLKAGYVLDASDFPTDSLFCEYVYLVDLDQGTFEVYGGFNREKPTAGRWKDMRDMDKDGNPSEYYPCDLLRVWRLDDLPSNDEFLAAFEKDEE